MQSDLEDNVYQVHACASGLREVVGEDINSDADEECVRLEAGIEVLSYAHLSTVVVVVVGVCWCFWVFAVPGS